MTAKRAGTHGLRRRAMLRGLTTACVGALWLACCVLGVSTLGAGAAFAQTQADPERGARPGGERIPALATTAMVATANPHATAAGLEILRAGGNAVDAAAAAQFALNVVEPQSSGVGGGGFLLIYWARDKNVVGIDGREEAPAAADPAMFLDARGEPQPFYPQRITGGNPVGVPGLLMALHKALSDYGSMTLAQVLAPAIRLAEGGFAVSPRLAAELRQQRERLALFPATRAVFFDAAGEPLTAGAMLRQPELARTLRLLAAQGIAPFYAGEIGRDIVRAVREAPLNPGRMTAADLAGYDAPLREPVRATYRGYTLVGMPPPASGGVTLLQMLQLLELGPEPPGGSPAPGSPAFVHRFVQAARLAYADRERFLADADFVPVPVAGLLDTGYARRRAQALNWAGPLAPMTAGEPPGLSASGWGQGVSQESRSTTHLSVVDGQRNMVALTSSIEQAFGSAMVVPGRGFLLNNELTDFSPRPRDDAGREIANRAEGDRRLRRTALDHPQRSGGKRPRSSMAPTLVLRDGEPVGALGSPGGPRIIQYVAWVLLLVLDHGWDVQRAIAAPQASHLDGTTVLEPGPGPDAPRLAEALTALGHQVQVRELASGLQAVWIDRAQGRLLGAADPRREGQAEGY